MPSCPLRINAHFKKINCFSQCGGTVQTIEHDKERKEIKQKCTDTDKDLLQFQKTRSPRWDRQVLSKRQKKK